MAIGHPAKSRCPFLYAILLTEESNRRFSTYPPSDRSICHALVAWQSGILQSRGPRFCMLIFPTGKSNCRFSVQTPSDHSIGHALVAWQSGILQNWGARFCMLSFRPGESNCRFSFQPLSDRSIGMRLSHSNRASCKVGVPVFVSRPLSTEEPYRRSIVQTLPTGRVQSLAQRPDPLRPQHRPCAHRMAIGHPAKSGCLFLYGILPTGRVQSQAQPPDLLRPQYRPCAFRMAIGYPAKSGCPFLYAILPTGESDRRFSV